MGTAGLEPGSTLGHYRVINRLGAGGMGEVYVAHDTKLRRNVALKLLAPEYSSDSDFKKRFAREAEATASLNHPGVVTIHEVGEFQGRPYFVMELVEGQTLSEFSHSRTLTIDELVDLTMLICDGLAAAHEKGIVHRDVKPSNILIDPYGRPRIVDFGLAAVHGGEQLTKAGSTLGTIGYMSPEQSRGSDTDERSDLFSLGVVLYELVTGRNPFIRDNHIATAQAIVSENPDPLLRYRSDVPDILQGIVSKLMEKDPDMRYQSARDVMADLRRLRSQSGLDAPTETYIAVTTQPRRRGLSRVSIAVGALLAVVAATVIVYLTLDTLRDGGSNAGGDHPAWDKSIAVLPFRDFSPGKDQEYLCDGMTDAIIGKLSVLNNLKVISMTSVMRYKEADRDIRKIGRELEVSTVLEGSVQREDNRIRVRAQLINVDSDAHLWSQTYDKELQSIFAVQDDISRSIADAMKLELFGDEQELLDRRSTDNVEAYNLYMQGRYSWRKRTEESIRSAIRFFERAIELDSNYAMAQSGLADAWAVLPSYSPYPRDEALVKAREAAAAALRIDEKLAEAHASMGLILYNERVIDQAESEFRRAIELNPGYAWSYVWFSNLLNRQGRYNESLEQLETAYRLDPLNTVTLINLGLRKRALARWEEADEYYKRALEIEPTANNRERYAQYLLEVGQYDSALYHYSVLVDEQPDNPYGYFEVSEIHGMRGRYSEALEIVDRYLSASADTVMAEYMRANLYYQTERYDSALTYYRRALDVRPDSIGLLEEIGYTYTQLGNYDEALETADRLTSLRPGAVSSWAVTGEINMVAGNIESALAAYGEALRLEPDYVGARQGTLAGCLYMRDFDRVEALVEEMFRNEDESEGTNAVIAKTAMYVLQGRLLEALELLDSCISADTLTAQFAHAYYNSVQKMLILDLLGDKQSALEEAGTVVELGRRKSPGDPLAWRDYSVKLLAETGDFDGADEMAAELRIRIESTGKTIDTFANSISLGAIAMARGDTESAVEHLESAARSSLNRFSTNFLQIRYMLGHAYLQAGMYEEAERQFRLLSSTNSPIFLRTSTWVAMIPYYLAVSLDKSGDTEEATDYYEMFIEAWDESDAEIRELRQAKERISELQN